MKTKALFTLTQFILLFITLSLSSNIQSRSGFPRTELPFCPGGGPPGWMNYFDQQRNKNIVRRYPPYRSPYLNTYYYQPMPGTVVYYERNPYRPYYYSPYRDTAMPTHLPQQRPYF